MTTKTLRREVQQYIEGADVRFLKMVHVISKEYDKSTVVGYTTKGEPITKPELVARVKDASKRVKSGDYVPHEDLEKEVENW